LLGSKIKISLAKLFDAVNVPCNIEASILGNVFSIEEKAKAYKNDVVAALGDIRDPVIRTAQDHQFNTVRIGYPPIKTEDINLRDEFNCQHTYSSPVKKAIRELPIISEVVAAMYEIEYARINLDGKNTTSSDLDNDTCFLHINTTPTFGTGDQPGTYYTLYRKVYDAISGIINSVTAFNVELSPKRCLLRHGNYLRSIFYWNEAKYLNFTTSDRNAELKTVSGAEVIEEKADVLIGDLADPIFLPLTVSGKGRSPKNLIEAMETTPNGSASFVIDGVTYYGFITDIGIQPANNAEQEFTALLRPDNNLNELL
jgi:hypothetical protein